MLLLFGSGIQSNGFILTIISNGYLMKNPVKNHETKHLLNHSHNLYRPIRMA